MDRRAGLDEHPVSGPLSRRSVAVKRTNRATRPSSVCPTTGEGWKLTHLQRRRGPRRRDAVLHCVLDLLEGAHLDLAHALAAEAEFLGQLRKRDLFFGEPARLEDAPLALVEHGERIGQRLGDGVADREKTRPVEDDGAEKCGRPVSSGVTSALGYNLVQEASDA
jgi:hypothetical protein